MQNELQILNGIEKNEYATQRDLARSTGMSLGNVNLLIKRLVKKGFLKMEKLNAKTIRYILTPQGMKEKAQATYSFVVSSYKLINDININIERLIQSLSLNENKNVMLFGNQDEIFELIIKKFEQVGVKTTYINNAGQLSSVKKRDTIVLVWHPEFSDILESNKIECINILDRI